MGKIIFNNYKNYFAMKFSLLIAAVAKTAAIKNIQKALTARILKRLDDGQPLVEVAGKMKAIEGVQPQINDMERRLGIMQSVGPVLENAIKTLQKVVDVRGMGKK